MKLLQQSLAYETAGAPSRFHKDFSCVYSYENNALLLTIKLKTS